MIIREILDLKPEFELELKQNLLEIMKMIGSGYGMEKSQ